MITAIAIDDEPLALKVIERFCAQSGCVNLLKTFTQTNDAAQFLAEHTVHLLFLDINMPSISGIDFYRKMVPGPMLIFTTAYSEYAVEGFNLEAIDYLLKPFTYKRFSKAVEKAMMQHALVHRQEYVADSFITVRADYSLIKVVVKDIFFIESLDNYVKIHIRHQKPVLARMPMKTIVELLPKAAFVRIHRSYLLPVSVIRSIRNKTVYIEGHELPVGSSYEKELIDLFHKGNLNLPQQ